MRYSMALVVAILLVTAVSTWAENWPNWRGPGLDGVAAVSDYPLQWGSEENIAWKLKLPGVGASTPVVWEDKIFLTAEQGEKNMAICVDRGGNLLWQTELGTVRPGKNRKGTGCNPSATTDGKYVFFYFKSGDLACLDLDGQVVWRKNLQELYGEDTLWWDLGTSPVLTDEAVVVACIHSGPSYVVAMEKGTGKVLWKADRNLGAPEEAAQSYTTPLVLEHDGRQIVVVLGADHVTAHDAQTGSELWRVGGLNPTNHMYFRSIASPVAADSIVIAPYARGESLTAIRLGGQGDVTNSHVVWRRTDLGADVPTPAVSGDRMYLSLDKGGVVCLDVATGETIWRVDLERNRNDYSASPVVAGKRIYVTREDGKTFVVEDGGQEGRVLAGNELGEFVVSTPVLVDGQILLRTFEHLYCVGQRAE